MTLNTTTLHSNTDSSSSLSGLLARSGALHGLPTPLNDEEGGGDCYPSEDNETNP